MNFIGCDVSKQKLDCALLCANSPDKPLHKIVPNNAAGVRELLAWVAKKAAIAPDSLHVVLEATGPYHEIAANVFFDAGCRVSVVNPAYPKHYAQSLGLKSKTDRADAVILARYGQATSSLRLWQPLAPCYRQLQVLASRHQALQADLQRERNRREKLLETQGDAFTAESLRRMLETLEKELDLVEQAIKMHIAAHPDLQRDKELLLSIPGIGEAVCRVLLPVLRSGRFENARQAAAYLGLVPVERQSGTSVKGRPRLSKAGDSRVRATLYFPALVATRCNPHIRALYERLLADKKCKMAALGACMRKLVHLCFGVLKTQTPYSPAKP